jgi:predicted nuclease of predicted toxin-antitoxin system
MRLYLDQMFRVELQELLRAEGHDVLRAAETGQSVADDSDVLRLAIDTDRTLITLDEDFGDWAILPLDKHAGVIRVKTHPTTTANVAALLLPFLAAHHQEDLRDHLVIISRTSERWITTGTDG